MNTSTFQERPCIEWGVAARALPGQTVSGDLHLVKPFFKGVLLAVVDGLGHGDEATVAAQLAVTTLERNAEESILPPQQIADSILARHLKGNDDTLALVGRINVTNA